MATYSEKSVLIDDNIFLKTYRATKEDHERFITDVNEQLRLGLLFDHQSTPNSLDTAIQTYLSIRDGLYLNQAQQVSLDYKDREGKPLTKGIFLTKDEYLKLKLLSAMDDQNKVIKAYQRLQDLILGNQFLLKDNQLEPSIFTFEMYRDRVLGLFDTLQGDLPNKMDELLKGYQKSYEESMEALEDLVTSNNPLRSGYYRMYNQNPEVRQTVNAFKRAVVEKAAIEANENSEFKQMELGLMKLLQYGSLDERLRKQILALIKQNAEGIATVTGGANENYAMELNNLLNQWSIPLSQIQKPTLSTLADTLKQGWSSFTDIFKSKPIDVISQVTPTPSSRSIVTDNYLQQLEKDLSNLSEEVTKTIGVLNPVLPEDQQKLKMYEELLANLELLLGLIMDIKLASVKTDTNLKPFYENLKMALKNVIDETKELNKTNQEIAELMTPIAKAMEGLTNLPKGEPTPILTSQAVISPNQVASEPEPEISLLPEPEQIQVTSEQLPAIPEEESSSEEVKPVSWPLLQPELPEPKELQAPIITYDELSKTHTVVNVPGDGWCFFYAVNGALGKPYEGEPGEQAAEALIQQIQSLSDYKGTKDNKVWATDLEMVATANVLDKCIYIYLKYTFNGTNIRSKPLILSREGTKPCEENSLYLLLDLGELDQSLPEDDLQLMTYLNEKGYVGRHFSFFKETPKPMTTLPPMTPIGRRIELPPLKPNPIAELEQSPKQQIIQNKLVELLKSKLPEFSTASDPKFTISELNTLVSGLSNGEANLLRIAFVIANIQENVESNDRDMDGLTPDFFSKMIRYFEKSRLSTAYFVYPISINEPMKQMQIDLYCMLVDQLYALHQKSGAVYTYAANTEGRNFKSIDSRGTDLILLDTILPKFNKDEVYIPSYIGAVQTYADIETYLRDLGDVRPVVNGMLKSHFITLKKMDNNTNRRNFLTGCIDYLVAKYQRDLNGKQILYKLLFGRDSWGSYAGLKLWGGDINLSGEIKDMDGGANATSQPIQLDKLKEAIQKLDDYRKTLRSTQEELNSWKEKYTTYNKSVDITKNFRPDKVIDPETTQTLKRFYEELGVAYQNVIDAKKSEKDAMDERDLAIKQATDKADEATKTQKEKSGTPEQSSADEAVTIAQKEIATVKLDKNRLVEEKKALLVKAEDNFKDELELFLKNTFALSDTNRSETISKFVSLLKKALPGEISVSSSTLEGLSQQLLSVKNLMEKLEANTELGNYYIDTEIVSIYEFLKGKAADLKKFNTERFNAMDKTIREIYQFVLTINKPLESKDKFKTKRLEFEALLDGVENVADDQRFKDLIIDSKKKNIKGLIPTIKDIKRLLETDIDYFTSLFQQKATSILKEQELKRQQQELQVRRAQPGPFAFFGQQPVIHGGDQEQFGGAEIDKETRRKLNHYFGIEKTEDEEYKQYKDVQLYLDAFNKLIDSYKFSLTTVTDPAAALALSGDKSLFNMIYEKYIKSSEDENKGEFIASQELATALETNNLVPRDVLRVSMRDKIIILFTTLFMRLITLSIVEFMIEKGVLKNLKYTLLAYLGFFSIIFIAFTALVNLDMYRLRIVFNYLNFHANSDKVYSYIILLWTFGAIIYYIITNVNQDINVTNTSEDVKARLIYRIQVVSLIVWLFLTIMVFIF